MAELDDWNASEGISHAFKQLVKELVWRTLYRHRPNPHLPAIAIFSSRRGGSTLMMEILAANDEVSFSDQPFSLYTATRPQLNKLPLFAYSQILKPDKKEWDQIDIYVRAILEGKLTVNGPWKFWRTPTPKGSSRMVLKITDAKSIAKELVERFSLVPIIMTRHPISQALSVEKNGWDTTSRAFLRNSAFVEEYLSTQLLRDAEAILHDGDPMKERMLDWTLENLPLMKSLNANRDWLYLPYETLVSRPEESIEKISNICHLHNTSAMIAQLLTPSRSTKRSSSEKTRNQISAGDRSYILSRWRSKVDTAAEASLLEIPAHFGLPLYQVGLDEPVWPMKIKTDADYKNKTGK